MIRVLVDSAADYVKEELQEKNIELVPLNITVNDEKNYKDELELSRETLYNMMLEGKNTIKTSQPSPQDFVEVFERIKANRDELICILLSSALSGTYQSAVLAKDLVDYDKIYLVDSLSATVAIKILADHAVELIDKGWKAEKIVEKLEEVKGRIRISAAVDTLKYLYLGGRVSRTTAIVADTVNIKPGITLSPEGTVAVVGKYLGIGRAVKDFTKRMKNASVDTEFPVFLIYSHNKENIEKLNKSLTDAGIQADAIHELGATLGVHVGPGAFGMIYVEK